MGEQIQVMTDSLLELLTDKKYADIRDILVELNPADIAILLQELPEEKLPLLFRLLPKELAAETFVEMDAEEQELLIRGFSDNELKEVWEELYLDDAVDIVEEMPANVVKRILKNTDPQTRKVINELLKYPEDSAGSIMTIEFVDLKRHMTVEEAIKRIRRTGVDKETIYTCYVIDENRRLLGMVSVRTLLLAEEEDRIEDIMESNVISVNTLEDKELVAGCFEKYDFLAMPVVDDEGRLVGIVTVDDAIDVLQEEATEDIERMAAIIPSDKPYMKTGVLETWKSRIPWLVILMLAATFTSMIINHFESALAAQVVLTAFIPMLLGTGGNSGGQASVVVIRSISLGELEFSDLVSVVWKEIRVAVLCGLTLAVVNFVKLMLLDQVGLSIALAVSVTIALTVLCAKVVGCVLPILAKKVGFDPAVMANPFITTVVDVLSLVIYFQVATAILGL